MLRVYKNEKLDVFILAGQSNSEGWGFGETESPYEFKEIVLQMNGDFSVGIACERVMAHYYRIN